MLMLQKWRTALLAAGAFAVAAGSAYAQPANCRDINNDGAVNATDGSVLENRLLNPGAIICGGPSAANIDCADLNDNGVIDTGDRVLLAQSLAGVETLFPPCVGPPPATCPGGPVSGNITTNTHWGPKPCTVNLAGGILVTSPAVLTVDPGVVVQGIKNPANPAALIILRGAKLDANGTSADPIVFTSNQAPGARDIGDWGGISLNGSAPVNFPSGEGSAEGLPPGLALYGGPDVADNSGRLRFVRVEFSGVEFSPDNELNVLTQNGLGSGTIVDHVQAHRGNDDCFEWFGGTVREKYLYASACRDDYFDWQIGFRGSLQFGIAHQSVAGVDGSGRNGIEADNNEFGFDNLPRSNPRMCNLTMIGAAPQGLVISGSGANLRRGTAGTVSNTIFEGWNTACLDVDDDQTIARGCVNGTTLRTGADTLLVKDSICFSNGALSSGSTTAPACTPAQLVGLWGPSVANPGIAALAAFPAGNPLNPAIYVPSAPLPGPDCQAVDPGAFDSAPFIGALQNGGVNWLTDSTACGVGQVAGCWLNVELQ
jgi:hypothetical protein